MQFIPAKNMMKRNTILSKVYEDWRRVFEVVNSKVKTINTKMENMVMKLDLDLVCSVLSVPGHEFIQEEGLQW